MKRSVMILVLENIILVRPPSKSSTAPIHRYIYEGMLINDTGDQILTKWLKSGVSPRSKQEMDSLIEKERKLYKEILDKVQYDDEELKAIVKQEELDDFEAGVLKWSLELKGAPVVIPDVMEEPAVVHVNLVDEESPDRKRRRRFFADNVSLSAETLEVPIDLESDVPIVPNPNNMDDEDDVFGDQEEPSDAEA